jgi:hypothetical protein
MQARFLATALAALFVTVFMTAAEAKDLCTVPSGEWQSKAALARKLEGEGWKIRVLKVDLGCYEVYGTDGSGKARETHFNPKTFQSVLEE